METFASRARRRRMWSGLLTLFVLLPWTGLAVSWARQERTTGRGEVLLPSGEGADLTRQLCGSGCHSLRIFIGLRESPRGWEDIVRDMISNGAAIRDQESDVIAAYLAEVFGPDSPPLVDANRARKEDLKKLPGLDDSAAGRLLDFRDQNGRFESIEQVREVLGPEVFEKVKGYLTVIT